MHERMQSAFDAIRAEEALKQKTQLFLTEVRLRRRPALRPQLLAAAMCFLLMLTGGTWFYFTPTVDISIDINPSLELSVNRLDQVIGVRGYNADGVALADSLSLRYIHYEEAIERILASETIRHLLAQNESLSIGVIGAEDAQSAQILTSIESHTAHCGTAYCYTARAQEVEGAHGHGLSYGKYRAWLMLQSLDERIALDDVRDMTMREIYALMESLSGDTAETFYQQHGSHGEGRRHKQ